MSKQARIWVISDTHFGHALMAQTRGFNGDIEAHDKALVAAWNAVVGDYDTVWHLGDVYFRNGYQCLPHLKGAVKKLVLGNHDANLEKYKVLSQYFQLMCGAACVGQNILTHIPVHPNQLNRFRLNIHGHTHAGRVYPGEIGEADLRYVPVSVEHLEGFKPILLQQAIQQGVK